MVKPEIVDRIRELSGQGLGSKRIAREVHVSRNSVRRYLAGATAGFQERPAARLLFRHLDKSAGVFAVIKRPFQKIGRKCLER